MIAPEAGLSVSRQCALLAVARQQLLLQIQPEHPEELELLERLDRIFTDVRSTGPVGCRWHCCERGFGWPPPRPAADAQARAVGGPTEAEHQQAAPRAPGLPVPPAQQDD